LPYLRLLGAQVAIGAAAIFARFALSGAGPLAVSALRLGIAAVIALAIALPFRRLSMRREGRAFLLDVRTAFLLDEDHARSA
jgi:threonine/homoserine efflux transporter RhtA